MTNGERKVFTTRFVAFESSCAALSSCIYNALILRRKPRTSTVKYQVNVQRNLYHNGNYHSISGFNRCYVRVRQKSNKRSCHTKAKINSGGVNSSACYNTYNKGTDIFSVLDKW